MSPAPSSARACWHGSADRPGGADESPHPAAASPLGSCHEAVGHRGRASPYGRAGSRRRQARASSFSPAVPPMCHKQRSPALSSGQSRSLGEGGCAGRTPLTWGGGVGRNCMACKGSGIQIPLSSTCHNASTISARGAACRDLPEDYVGRARERSEYCPAWEVLDGFVGDLGMRWPLSRWYPGVEDSSSGTA
jgi:hypothetical protein